MTRLARFRLLRLRRQGRWTGPPFHPAPRNLRLIAQPFDWERHGG